MYISIVTCTLFAFILFPGARLDVCNWSKNVWDMLGIYIREWKITCVTVVASTHDQPTFRHSRFCTNSTRVDTDKTSLVKMTKTHFHTHSTMKELDLLSTQHRSESWSLSLKSVEVGWSLAKPKPVNAVCFADFALTVFCQTWTLFNLSDHDSKRCWVHNLSNSSSFSEHRKFVFLSFSLRMFLIVYVIAYSPEY